MPGHHIVEGNAGFYVVNGTCCCDDAANRSDLIKGYCKHRLVAVLYAEQQGGTAPATLEPDRSLEDQLEDIYPKVRSANSLR
jgi:hypothetical protein